MPFSIADAANLRFQSGRQRGLSGALVGGGGGGGLTVPTVFADNQTGGAGADWINPLYAVRGSDLYLGGGGGTVDAFLPRFHHVAGRNPLPAPINLSTVTQQDGHSMPALYVRPDGRLVIMWTAHGPRGADGADLRVAISTDTTWTAFGPDVDYLAPAGIGQECSYVYWIGKHPVSGRNWSMHRGNTTTEGLNAGGFWSTHIVEWNDNFTAVTTTAKVLISGPDGERPYTRCSQVGNLLHITCSRSGPDDPSVTVANGGCPLYHFYYDDADQTFRRTDGTLIVTLASVLAGTGSVDLTTLTPFYDGLTYGPGWQYAMEVSGGVAGVSTSALSIRPPRPTRHGACGQGRSTASSSIRDRTNRLFLIDRHHRQALQARTASQAPPPRHPKPPPAEARRT